MNKFKNTALALSLASVLGLSTVAMAAEDKNGPYVAFGGGIAIPNVKDADNKLGFNGRAALGYKKGNLRYEVEGTFLGAKQKDIANTTVVTQTEISGWSSGTASFFEDDVDGHDYEFGHIEWTKWDDEQNPVVDGQYVFTSAEHREEFLDNMKDEYGIELIHLVLVTVGEYAGRPEVTETTETSIDDKAVVAMANIYYDFDNNSVVTPYVGAGIGYANITQKTTATVKGNKSTSSSSEGAFAYQAIAGVQYEVVENTALDLSYKYLGAVSSGLMASAQTVNLGISYRF